MGGQFNQAAALLVQPLLWQESRTEPKCLGQLCWIIEINCGGCFVVLVVVVFMLLCKTQIRGDQFHLKSMYTVQ